MILTVTVFTIIFSLLYLVSEVFFHHIRHLAEYFLFHFSHSEIFFHHIFIPIIAKSED